MARFRGGGASTNPRLQARQSLRVRRSFVPCFSQRLNLQARPVFRVHWLSTWPSFELSSERLFGATVMMTLTSTESALARTLRVKCTRKQNCASSEPQASVFAARCLAVKEQKLGLSLSLAKQVTARLECSSPSLPCPTEGGLGSAREREEIKDRGWGKTNTNTIQTQTNRL